MMQRRITLQDVADKAGVAKGTASVALSGADCELRIGEATRQRVLEAAAALGYYPNGVARGLSQRRLDTIGVLFSSGSESPFGNPYYAPLLEGICNVASAHDQNVTLYRYSHGVWGREAQYLPILCDGRCDGILLLAPPPRSGYVHGLRVAGVPFVVVHSDSETPDVSSVDVDNVGGAQAAAQCLLQNGHTRIAVFMHCAARNDYARLRLQGVQQALPHEPLVFEKDRESNRWETELDHVFALPPAQRSTAIFCLRDLDAWAVLRSLRARGVSVPQDVSVIGFDGLESGDSVQPVLTTWAQPLPEIARCATEQLLAQIRGTAQAGKKMILPGSLRIGSSVGQVL